MKPPRSRSPKSTGRSDRPSASRPGANRPSAGPRAAKSSARSPYARPVGERPAFDRKGPPRAERPSFDRKGPPRADRPSFDRKGPPRTERPSFERKGPQRPSFDRKGPPRPSFDRKGPPRPSSDRKGPFDRKGPPRKGPPRPSFERPSFDEAGDERPIARPTKAKRPELRPMSADPVEFPSPSPARVGDWLFTTRPEAELDLMEELVLADKDAPKPRVAGPALVAVPRKPKGELAFARQGFPIAAIIPAEHPSAADRIADAVLDALPFGQGRAARARGPQKFAFDAWVPDDDRTNPDSARAQELAEGVRAAIARRTSPWAALLVTDARNALDDNGMYAQLCLAEGQCYVGTLPARDAPSVAPGGRLRIHLPEHAPSRAAAKLLEAFAWLDRAPASGEMCVDLGAAPGGWTWVLLERRAHVLAIDPGSLDPIVAKKKGLTHLRADAFKFEPDEPIDWLVADMAWRPLEAAALYGKWARRGWARLLVANIKLPMRKKAEYLARVKDILDSSGWKNLRVRQLYHDREEVTVAGVRL